MNLNKLEQNLDVIFKDKNLLQQSLIHRSYLNENPSYPLSHNERLEFLGDAVLELVVTENLYKEYPQHPEGELTNLRAALVNSQMLAKIAAELEIGDFLLLSKGESKSTGRGRHYILANAFEAVIGAIYLDQGYDESSKFIVRNVLKELLEILEQKLYRDPKSIFQEEAQEKFSITPTYEVLKEWGPDHAKQFSVGVYLDKDLFGQGQGPSKQEAQQKAAEEALKKIN